MYNASNILGKAHDTFLLKSSNYLESRNFYRNIYLKSDHWKKLREEKLQQHNKCELCNTANFLDVHHINYRELFNVKLSDLMVLCRSCHEKEHIRLKQLDVKKVKRLNNKLRRIVKDKQYFKMLELAKIKYRDELPYKKEQKLRKQFPDYFRSKRFSNYVSIHY